MQSKDQVLQQLVKIMQELFEVDPSQVHLEAQLSEDLDIDSIDAVDMAGQLQELTGSRIEPAAFKEIRTVQDLVDATHALLTEQGIELNA